MNVYLIGSFMNDNFGDYLLYHETLKCIKEEFGSKVKVYSSNVSNFYKEFDDVCSYSHAEALKHADIVIFTGGGYFGEGDRKKLLWNAFFVYHYGWKALQVSISKKPYAIIGVGAGPFKYFFSRMITKKVFEQAEMISVRDEESKKFLLENRVTNPIEIHCDWILGMDKTKLLSKTQEMQIFLNDENAQYLVLHLISEAKNNLGMKILLEDVSKYLSKHPSIKVIATCDQSKEDVYLRTKEIAQRFQEKLAYYYEYRSPWELASILGLSDVILTDKLHVGIVGMNLGKSVVSVPLHSKTPRLYKQVKRMAHCKQMSDLVAGDVEKMLEIAFLEKSVDIEKFREDSRKNRMMVKKFIRKHLDKAEK